MTNENQNSKLIIGIAIPTIATLIIFAELVWAIGVMGLSVFEVGVLIFGTFIFISFIVFFAGRYINIIGQTTYYKLTSKTFQLAQSLIDHTFQGKQQKKDNTNTSDNPSAK